LIILKVKDLKVGDIIRPRGSKVAFDDHVVISADYQKSCVDIVRPIVAVEESGKFQIKANKTCSISDSDLVDFIRVRVVRTKEVISR
jgi:hypothetical protein